MICGSFAAPKPALFSFNKSSGGASDKSGAGSGAAASSAVAPGADSLKPFAALFSTSSAGMLQLPVSTDNAVFIFSVHPLLLFFFSLAVAVVLEV